MDVLFPWRPCARRLVVQLNTKACHKQLSWQIKSKAHPSEFRQPPNKVRPGTRKWRRIISAKACHPQKRLPTTLEGSGTSSLYVDLWVYSLLNTRINKKEHAWWMIARVSPSTPEPREQHLRVRTRRGAPRRNKYRTTRRKCTRERQQESVASPLLL